MAKCGLFCAMRDISVNQLFSLSSAVCWKLSSIFIIVASFTGELTHMRW